MIPLFEKRCGSYVLPKPYYSRSFYKSSESYASWPMSKILMFQEHLVIRILKKEFILYYTEIDSIKKEGMSIRITHHSQNVKKYVYLTGAALPGGLFRKICEVIKENKLKINIV